MKTRRVVLLTIFTIISTAVMVFGIGSVYLDGLLQNLTTAQATTELLASSLIFDATPGPDVPLLQSFASPDSTDADILARVVDYYNENRDELALLWREDDPTRLAALFSMYIVHISHPYGEAEYPASLTEFLSQPYAHCGTYTFGQAQIATALGLTYRVVEFVGEHAWLEVLVNGEWEVFDSTTNVWLSRNVMDLLAAEPREYRLFYTPMLDIDQIDAREHIALGYNMQRLRSRMPAVGVSYHPPGELRVGGEILRPGE